MRRCVIATALLLLAVALRAPTEPSGAPGAPLPQALTPAPLFRDPIFDGAADPAICWNPFRRAWWILYTQRRAKLDLPGVAWCHGSEIGVAESRDNGLSWIYLGQLPLSHPDTGYSFWAPDVIHDNTGAYHLFVTYVPGAAESHTNWGGPRYIFQYTSRDLWNWQFTQRVPVSSDYCIDPALFRLPNGAWRLWFKDEAHDSATLAVESRDLQNWQTVKDPHVGRHYGEAPLIFQFGGWSWLIKDTGEGLDVYRSSNLDDWQYQGKILDQPGHRNDDGSVGKHCDVAVCGPRAYIIYFTHPDTQDFPERQGILPFAARRSSLQAAELEVKNGVLLCDRDKPFRLNLVPPAPGP